jgi:hypothetical protein
VAKTTSGQGALEMLASCDTCETILRSIASHVHFPRTGDRDSADSMLAVKPAGGRQDIAPSWLVAESSIYSNNEYQRRKRATFSGKGEGKAKKGDGKGKKGPSGPKPKAKAEKKE